MQPSAGSAAPTQGAFPEQRGARAGAGPRLGWAGLGLPWPPPRAHISVPASSGRSCEPQAGGQPGTPCSAAPSTPTGTPAWPPLARAPAGVGSCPRGGTRDPPASQLGASPGAPRARGKVEKSMLFSGAGRSPRAHPRVERRRVFLPEPIDGLGENKRLRGFFIFRMLPPGHPPPPSASRCSAQTSLSSDLASRMSFRWGL